MSCWKLANSLSGGIIRILINSHKPIMNDINGNTLYGPFESFSDSNSSFPPPGRDLSNTPSRHIKYESEATAVITVDSLTKSKDVE